MGKHSTNDNEKTTNHPFDVDAVERAPVDAVPAGAEAEGGQIPGRGWRGRRRGFSALCRHLSLVSAFYFFSSFLARVTGGGLLMRAEERQTGRQRERERETERRRDAAFFRLLSLAVESKKRGRGRERASERESERENEVKSLFERKKLNSSTRKRNPMAMVASPHYQVRRKRCLALSLASSCA